MYPAIIRPLGSRGNWVLGHWVLWRRGSADAARAPLGVTYVTIGTGEASSF
jgi:hypothetical protein